ncbi:hypothetical protein [Permianibacter aggregans]|nr:hypothetical protein [Permianibacter aggregans]QGX39337.1 hypothetical protein E2H98_06560 [Permianibacter aggregans]QGX39345.1 hypothetical protein E2H98_06605 [Permianibacter aggregans]
MKVAIFQVSALMMLLGCSASQSKEYIESSPEGKSLIEFCGSQNKDMQKRPLSSIFEGLAVADNKLDAISEFGKADIEVEVNSAETGKLVSRTQVYVGNSEKFCADNRSDFVAIYLNERDSIVAVEFVQNETYESKGVDGLKGIERYVRF